MSLTKAQQIQTAVQLQKNYELSELTPTEIERDLGINERQLLTTLALKEEADPTTVWRLRDYMEAKIWEQGKVPLPYSVLKVNIWYPYE